MYVMYRVAYAPGPEDSPERDRTLRDFTAVTGREAEKAAREWAASRNQQRPPELREQWPWVLERWNGRGPAMGADQRHPVTEDVTPRARRGASAGRARPRPGRARCRSWPTVR